MQPGARPATDFEAAGGSPAQAQQSPALDEVVVFETQPLLRRIPSRRAAAAVASPAQPTARRRTSLPKGVRHAAAETFLLTRLAFTLLRYLGLSYRWILKVFALAVYAFLLLPGLLQVAYYYFFSSEVRRSVLYGENPRNRLDLYLPKDCSKPCPVFAFITGGAWIIGYKAWGALLGKRLAERGIIVACIDYRNFPHGTISDMVKDATEGISFICNNAATYGGDPNAIYLMGQSAGAHIAACALLEQAIRESNGEVTCWSISQIKAFFGLSGGYNMLNLVDHFHECGLYRNIFLRIMEGEQQIKHFSPEILVRELNSRAIASLPPTILIHGTSDYSIPFSASKDFAGVLQNAGVQVKLLLYDGKTHTDLFLQDPLRGGKDQLVEDVLSVVFGNNKVVQSHNSTHRRLVSEWRLQLARKISPF